MELKEIIKTYKEEIESKKNYQEFTFFLEDFLEIKTFQEKNTNEIITKITLTLGGPTIFLKIDESEESAKIEGYWGTEKQQEKINFYNENIQNIINLLKY